MPPHKTHKKFIEQYEMNYMQYKLYKNKEY